MKAERLEVNMKHNGNNSHETRISLLEQSITNINETLIRFEKRFDKLDQKIDQGFKDVNNRIDQTNNKIDQGIKDINGRMWTNFFWMLGGFAGILSLVAHFFKWI